MSKPTDSAARHAMWIDCDPGHDDVAAIILAAGDPCIELIGISVVAGNADLRRCTLNAMHVAATLQLTCPVIPGAAQPLLRPTRVCPAIHGETGLDSAHGRVPWPALEPDAWHSAREAAPAPARMYELIMQHWTRTGEQVRLVATGPLTNVALLLRTFPRVTRALHSITFMGGGITRGNVTPAAEFNIQVDPEAAAIVMQAGHGGHADDAADAAGADSKNTELSSLNFHDPSAPVPVRVCMVPLEVTHTALVTEQVMAALEAAGGEPFGQVVTGLMQFFAGTYKSIEGMDAPPLHDPCAVLASVHPELMQGIQAHVQVDTTSPLCAGQTVVDVRNVLKSSATCKNVFVCTSMDVPAFWEHMVQAVRAVAPSANAILSRQG